MLRIRDAVLGLFFLMALALHNAVSDEPARTLPPPGIPILQPDADRLSAETKRLSQAITQIRSSNLDQPRRALLPDIEIFVKAVDYALRGSEFYHPREFNWADSQLCIADQRLKALAAGDHPWTTQRGLVVRGFRSSLDDSVQPYGLVIPDDLDLSKPSPLYVWLHGRGDKALDLQFIQQRLTSPGQIRPKAAIVLHPFGRYCNGYKSAGEVDVFEAVEVTCREYRIDPDRILLCGFSMGGAGVWHLGSHCPDRWTAMSPGAGFVDVRRYQNLRPDQLPPWYEQALWNVYDVPSYARNLLNIPLVAYSGEFDKQKQSADIMEECLAKEGLAMTHVIGKGVAHKYEPSALNDVLARLQRFERAGLNHHPESIHLQTRTLRYNRCHWVEMLGLEEHWRDARVDAERMGMDRITVSTHNVSSLRLASPWPDPPTSQSTLVLDKREFSIQPSSWQAKVVTFQKTKDSGGWRIVPGDDPARLALRKSPGLQGPIDDAYLKPFLVVRPTGIAAHPAVEKWVASEQARFRERWRTLFRGEFREMDDVDVTDNEMKTYNLLLWGDPSSNKLLAKVAKDLPIQWNADSIQVPGHTWASKSHVLLMIYPNPLPAGRGRYIVTNSGVTFREAHDRTNSLQNPKLPDWAVLDLSTPPNDQSPGKVADAAFFDEAWKYQPKRSIRDRNEN